MHSAVELACFASVDGHAGFFSRSGRPSMSFYSAAAVTVQAGFRDLQNLQTKELKIRYLQPISISHGWRIRIPEFASKLHAPYSLSISVRVPTKPN